MAIATGLISSLFDVVSSHDVPFAIHSSYNACIMTLPKRFFILLLCPIPIPTTVKVTICGTRIMAFAAKVS